jgi:FkbM family methyltransferase
MTEYPITETSINGRWSLMLPEHRAARPEWGWWEAIRLGHMNAMIKPDDVIYDIGAEEGDLSALFASWVPDGGVVLFEPNPKVWPCIKLCFEANQLQPLGWFAGFASDTTYLPAKSNVEDADIQGWPLCAHGPIIPGHGFRHIAEHREVTPSISLDDFMIKSGVIPTVLTMDVEGGELHVLKGAKTILTDVRPQVWISVHLDFMWDLYGETVEELYELMDSYGYDRRFLCTDHESHNYFSPV